MFLSYTYKPLQTYPSISAIHVAFLNPLCKLSDQNKGDFKYSIGVKIWLTLEFKEQN